MKLYIYILILIILNPLVTKSENITKEPMIKNQHKYATINLDQAREYALKKYQVELFFDDSLKKGKIHFLENENISAEKWINQYFKIYNKIVYHNKNGEITSLKILGIKDRNTLYSVSELNKSDSHQKSQETSANTATETNKVMPPSLNLDTITSNQIEDLPKGVTIIHDFGESALLPEGVEIADPHLQETETPQGVEIYK